MKDQEISNIEYVERHRKELINNGIADEKLRIFDAMYNSYLREMKECNTTDFTDSQTNDFIRLFRSTN